MKANFDEMFSIPQKFYAWQLKSSVINKESIMHYAQNVRTGTLCKNFAVWYTLDGYVTVEFC